MGIRPRDFSEMVSSSIDYLSNNTQITFLESGSIARSLIDATNLELVRLQDFVVTNYDNSYLSAASGSFLDLFGDSFGLPRKQSTSSRVFKEDGSIRFYVRTGVLGTRLPDPDDSTKGLIPAGTTVTTTDGSVQYQVDQAVSFPTNRRSVYVGAKAISTGVGGNVGANQLLTHSLSHSDVFVTNDLAVDNGQDIEADNDYRFRLTNAFSTRLSNSVAAVVTAALSVPGVVRSEVVPFARGAGTFDILLVPRSNKLPRSVLDQASRSVEAVTAFGISHRLREPEYVTFKLSVRLRFVQGTSEGFKEALRDRAESAILNYVGTLPLGGELVINQVRATVLSVSNSITDLSILEFCVDGKPHAIRNFKLEDDELFIPDEEREAVLIL